MFKIENNKISTDELKSASNAVNRIIFSEVLEKQMTDILTNTDKLTDSNKILTGKVSMLFIDIRESTKLPNQFESDDLVKIYRSYIRIIVQAVRYSGGVVRDFMGDGVLATFIDDQYSSSEDKAVYSARYMTTLLDKLLNPILNKELSYRISYGIGVHTGEVSLSKVGMRGRDPEQEEIEYGTVWIGNSTNLASKFSSAVSNSTIFISSSTHSNLSDYNESKKWKKFEIIKGNNLLNGYIINQYYLNIEDEIEPVVAQYNEKEDKSLDIFTEIYEDYLSKLSLKSSELGKKEAVLANKEKELNSKLDEVRKLEDTCTEQKKKLQNKEYNFYYEILQKSFLKSDYIVAMERKFWEDTVTRLMCIGKQLEKTESEIKEEICVYMVNIYSALKIWDEAYEYLLIQASNKWLHLNIVQLIINNVSYSYELKSAVKNRLRSDKLSEEYKKDFLKIEKWLENK
ncbi:adenylate/guanylate cyclase domain-containing protein [Salinicoccus roseus]|uniref:adenylate/guanylate cyclase domain-containing protein n=1 Tax=Salinicoccus roseus TaxID=45670 RepID=UPI001CA72707|nr:adenylate/guanylate cyclase domain-containing protein [Salinicoccus roseus]MBY8909853.1 adenylate/guanylate cyclase domain-containing protein [Salinicoccus roseus]